MQTSLTPIRYLPGPKRQRGKMSNSLAAAIGLFLAAAIALALAWQRNVEPEAATLIPQPLDLPDFALTAGNGEAFNRESLAGRYSLVFFGFTHCPDICPITLQQLTRFQRRLEEDSEDDVPQIVFVSVDPERDTVEAVDAYTSAFGGDVIGLRGALANLTPLSSALGAYHSREVTDDSYVVEHSAAVLVIDDQARFSAVFAAPHDVDAMVRDWPLVTAGWR